MGELRSYSLLDMATNGSLRSDRNHTSVSAPDLSYVINSTAKDHLQSYHGLAIAIEQFLLPVICLLGFLGNTASAVVFLKKPLRKSSCSLYLAARSVCDNGFLATLVLVWISSTFRLHLSNIRGLCQILGFFTYVFGCVSVWLVVFVTLENYFRICRPFVLKTFCTTRIAKIAIFILVISVMCFYNFPLWTMDHRCYPLTNFFKLVQIFVLVDTFITLIIPTVIMVGLMGTITLTVCRSHKLRRRLTRNSSRRSLQHPTGKVTRLLYSVTVSFVCLNVPSHVVRLRAVGSAFLQDETSVSTTEVNAQTIALLVYYMSMSINAFVYFSFSSNFRSVFTRTFIRCSRFKCGQRTEGIQMDTFVSQADSTHAPIRRWNTW